MESRSIERRAELLDKLAQFRDPPDPLRAELRTFDFDWIGPALLVLTASHFRSVMDRYLAGELTAQQVEEWAECLESRDDVGFDPTVTQVLRDLQFRLANPDISERITPLVVTSMRAELD